MGTNIQMGSCRVSDGDVSHRDQADRDDDPSSVIKRSSNKHGDVVVERRVDPAYLREFHPL